MRSSTLPFLLAMSLPACEVVGKSCTLIGCYGSLVVTIPLTLDDGAYRVEASSDGVDGAISFDVVDGAAVVPEDALVTVEITDDGLLATFTVNMGATPETVAITLSDDAEAVLAAGDVAPVWGETVYPNGEDCDDGCTSGVGTLEI